MKKSTKGALAAASAGVLLLGGAGSLAYWSDSDSVAGGTFTAGSLSLTPVGSCGTWNLDTQEPGGQPFLPGADKLVPGDVVSKVCQFTVDAKGTHLKATVGTTGGTTSGDLLASGPLTIGHTVEIGDDAVTELTEDNDGETIDVTVTVKFPYGVAADNDSQTDSAQLEAIDIVTTQVHD